MMHLKSGSSFDYLDVIIIEENKDESKRHLLSFISRQRG